MFQVQCWCLVPQQEGTVFQSECVCSSLLSLRSLQGSLEELDITTAEEEEGEEEERSSVLSESIGHDNILAYLTGTNSSTRDKEWTPER